jgi:hypothetical protein
MRSFAGSGPLLADDRARLEYSRYLGYKQRPLDVSPLLPKLMQAEIVSR